MDRNVREYINSLLDCYKDIFICFKTEIKNESVVGDRFFVYAHGGLLCKLPKENCARSNIELFDKKYIQFLENADIEKELKEKYRNALEGSNEERMSFLCDSDNFRNIMTMMENRAKGNLSKGWHEHKERQRENVIAKINNDMNNNYVVCDMEYCVSLPTGKKAKADLVAVSINSNDEVSIAYIEYKCTNAGLKGVSLAAHYCDMREYSFYHEARDNEKIVKLSQESVIYRYNKMVEYGLIQARKIELGNKEILSKILFLVTNMNDIRKPLLSRQYNKLLEEISLNPNSDLVMFVQNQDENIKLTNDRFCSCFNI